MSNLKASREIVKNVIDNALKNYFKPEVSDYLVAWYNASCENTYAFDDMVYKNDDDAVDYLLKGLTPSQVIRNVNDYRSYDAFVAFNGYGHLHSFHFVKFIEMLKDNRDLIDYVVDYVDIATLNKLNKLADQDTQNILKDAYEGVK